MSEDAISQARAAVHLPKVDSSAQAVDAGRNVLVVGIGASAGGLEPCKKFVAALPADSGMTFIVVQHLDPSHETMMVELLAGHPSLIVQLAENMMPLEREHLYVIPPGAYLSVSNGILRLSKPQEHHGARLPFDYLLRSMANDCGRRAVCVVLSGRGADGSMGLEAIKENGGQVIVQDPDEASYDDMPRSAIMTGKVDSVLRVAAIPAALAGYRRRMELGPRLADLSSKDAAESHFAAILELLHSSTAQDFRLYKKGTLERRIERRMVIAGIRGGKLERYLGLLRSDPNEIGLLAKDLLIHVTSFFRDPEVFELLSAKIVPELIRHLAPELPLRVWVAGCSTGEETYSLAILFHEQIALAARNIKLQIFASDLDEDAIATARTGLYPDSIAADVSPARLARFFLKEGSGYRVSSDLRASVVFTVQDVMADPPFSRIDMVSCRNLLIYLGPEAQAKVLSQFHFAIRDGGILLLGNAETVAKPDDRFGVIGDKERLYRRVSGKRVSDSIIPAIDGERAGGRKRQACGPEPPPEATLAELRRGLLIETDAPAEVLANPKDECLDLFGSTDAYVKTAQGNALQDLLALILRDGLARTLASLSSRPFGAEPDSVRGRLTQLGKVGQAIDLERELQTVRAELETANRDHEAFVEVQKAVNEEALSVNEEYQSTNEELISSKEELQSLNEELSALNSQLQDTLERQRTTSNDLQNVLCSTDVATLFLDVDLRIRFFTPAIEPLFSVIASDIGRPLSNLNSSAGDNSLLADAGTVLRGQILIEREVGSPNGLWYSRRILPYRTHGNEVEGVVITYTDVTERKRASKALEEAKQLAERANAAKSRFLAAASHDLRQPLQTLTLLQGLLLKTIDGEQAEHLVARSNEALAAMSSMLNTLLDINQIEAGVVSAKVVTFPINHLLEVLREEFRYRAEAHRLELRVVRCGLSIDTDPRILEQMIRNLLSNALKYTRRGKILMGCRRQRGKLSIEIWDTGIGIPEKELHTIFEEYHQVENASRDRALGLGLGLSIVQRLGNLLGHAVQVRSQQGKGSVFAVKADVSSRVSTMQREMARDGTKNAAAEPLLGMILIVEDDEEVRDLLRLYLGGEGHRTAAVGDGMAALDLVGRHEIRPDLVLADYNLPGGMDGLTVAAKLRERLRRDVPVVILTGDISTDALRSVAGGDCVKLNKPVKLEELTRVIQSLLSTLPLPSARKPTSWLASVGAPIIFVVDDDDHVRDTIRMVLEGDGRNVEDFPSCEAFLAAFRPGQEGCLLIDAYLPGMDGIELLDRLSSLDRRLPAIMITGSGDVAVAVRAMKAGASDFIEKPIGGAELLASLDRALLEAQGKGERFASQQDAASHIAGLTFRQRQVMKLVLAGHPSKNIAADLGISQRTVEKHRATIMSRTGSKSLPALARLSFIAADVSEVDA